MVLPTRSQCKQIILAVFIWALAVCTAFALWSFSAYDTSFFYEESAMLKPTNWLGAIGSFYASMLLFLWGVSTWLLVPLFFFIGYMVCRQYSIKKYTDQLIGWFILLCSHAALCSSFSFEPYRGILPGGFYGALIFGVIHHFIHNTLVEHIILLSILWTSFVLIARFSWVSPVMVVINATYQVISPGMVFMMNRAKDAMLTLYHAFSRHLPEKKVQNQLHEDEKELFTDPLWATMHRSKEIQLTKSFSLKNGTSDDLAAPFVLPDISLLTTKPEKEDGKAKSRSQEIGKILEEKLEHFGIYGKVISVVNGPTVTMFEYKPRIDMKISAILAREDDLALALQALSLRIIAPIPGTCVVGFEVANQHRADVLFGDCMTAMPQFSSYKMPLVLGKDIRGGAYIADLAALPHLLIAGSTGSGKSVGLHSIVVSLLYKMTPQELKLIIIDPKRIEFAPFADIPHLLFPIQTNAQQSIKVLQWAVKTMEERYEFMAQAGVRNIHDYHTAYDKVHLPFIVIVIDELADLMMTGGKDCQEAITRLAQMSRAAGIHLVVATQRPSVDVITGLIKVNFPARIAFKVASKIDSRTILDQAGGEKLLSRGDMLFLDPQGTLHRIQGAYISPKETAQVVSFLKGQAQPAYVLLPQDASAGDKLEDGDEVLYKEICAFLNNVDLVSISLLQRKFKIGYNRSARLFDKLESEGLISGSDGGKLRRVNKIQRTT